MMINLRNRIVLTIALACTLALTVQCQQPEETDLSPEQAMPGPVDIGESGASLWLRIYPPHGSELYPQHDVTWESYPVILRFDFQATQPSISNAIQLNDLDYRVYVAYDDGEGYEPVPFYQDSIDLYDKFGPGSLDLTPGVYLPPDATNLKIEASLTYRTNLAGSEVDRVAENTMEIDVFPYPGDSLYHRYRDGYVRRHLLNSGRGLSWTWLKEYEPGKDPKELLYHSRTFRAPDDLTRVYVPWIFQCAETDNFLFTVALDQHDIYYLGSGTVPGKLQQEFENNGIAFPSNPSVDTQLEGKRWRIIFDQNIDTRVSYVVESNGQSFDIFDSNDCGDSVKDHADAIYGSKENPLLRGGLAMAAFSLEYLSDHNLESLYHALKLFEYVEESEWRFPYLDGTPSGFFLRSRGPGFNCQNTGRDYCFASTDEIIGMTLGLYYLYEALEVQSAFDPSFRPKQEQVVALVERLATQLQHNYYFIVPPVPPDGIQEQAWLPQELQTGWSGTYMFQWYLSGAFKAITGNRYRPGSLTDEDQYWKSLKRLKWNGNGDDQKEFIKLLLDAELSASERAIYTIQGTGIGMFYSYEPYNICERFISYGLFVNEAHCLGSAFVTATLARLLTATDISVSDVTGNQVGDKISDDFGWWNFPMLLHAFQLGMADDTRDQDVVKEVRKTMSQVIHGVLSAEGATTTLDIDNLCEELGNGVVGPYCYLSDIDVPEHVGTPFMSPDYYAAAVALAYDLPKTVENRSVRARFKANSEATVRWNRVEFFPSLPAGKRAAQKEAGASDPNPDDRIRIGQAFCWEKSPNRTDPRRNRIQSGGGNYSAGLSNEVITQLWAGGVDAIIEGAGLDYLLPTALLRHKRSEYVLSAHESFQMENQNFPYLGVCFSHPRLLASGAPSSDDPCDHRFIRKPVDEFDSDQRNDTYSQATEIDWDWTYYPLTIDHATHTDYDPDQSSIIYARYTHLWNSEEIKPGDHDYFIFTNDEGFPLNLTVESGIDVSVLVDGGPAETLSSTPILKKKSITVPARERHTIVVRSERATGYLMQMTTPPVAENQVVLTTSNTAIEIILKAKSQGGMVVFELIDGPQNGFLLDFSCNFTESDSGGPDCPSLTVGVLQGRATVTYQPDANFKGDDSFSFKVRTENGVESNIAEVSISVD